MLCSKYDGQPVIIGMTDEGSQLREEVGGVGNVCITFLIPPTSQKAEYKIFINQTMINEVNIVNSVQPSTGFIDGISGADFGLTTEDQGQKHADTFNYYSDAF